MQFSTKIINWYHKNKRELPWRQEVNPYLIWLSEVILQQTRVNQGLPYYLKFVSHYPTIAHLANASEAEVLKDWQGLGYYSRARNLHSAAKTMVKKHGGEFPRTYPEILALEGIGPYTAAAIGSFAFGLPYPVIDGNVQRVVSRIFGIQKPVNSTLGRKEIEEVLNTVFDKKKPADFNQAIMEFGAMHCKPQQPLCNECPFEFGCYAKQHNLVQVLPAKEKKAQVKIRYFLYLVPQKGKHEFIVKRTANDIWKNLYEFPLIEMEEPLLFPNDKSIQSILKKNKWKADYTIKHISAEYKHVLTHRIIYARFIALEMGSSFQPEKDWIKKPVNNHEVFAFPVLMQKYFNER
jgi:A/G-specific adenine glycosylase